MTNNIELRAWDKRARKMREVDSVAFYSSHDIWSYNPDNTPKVACVWCYDIIAQENFISTKDIELLELMLYTGKIDKNKVKIFAGDIVETTDGDIGIVEYSEHFLEWRIKFYIGRPHLLNKEEYGVAMFDFIYPKMTLKVIGNKYENDIIRDFSKGA